MGKRRRVIVTSYKGGVGKTTVALNLAGAWKHYRRDDTVLVIDTDENRSARNWRDRSGENYDPGIVVLDQFETAEWYEDGNSADLVLMDTPGRPSAEELTLFSRRCDLILVPCLADAFSVDTLGYLRKDLKTAEVKTPCKILLTRARPGHSATDEWRKVLEEANQPLFQREIREYAAYEKAAAAGCLVKDARDRYGKKDDNAGKAWSDFREAVKELMQDLEVGDGE